MDLLHSLLENKTHKNDVRGTKFMIFSIILSFNNSCFLLSESCICSFSPTNRGRRKTNRLSSFSHKSSWSKEAKVQQTYKRK